ncbi:MAG: insulinase family protein, partial [Chloroflexi bacterium]|nr:insulinase family protein [Chloroflexota bacterium]
SALSLRTIGEDASLDRIARDALLDHYHTHYLPANCALIITGRVDVDHLHALVQHYFGAVTTTNQIPAAPVTPPLPKRGPQRVTVRGPLLTAESELIIGMRTVEWTHLDRWVLEVLTEIMEEALIKAIRFQRGLAYDVHAFTDYFTDTGYFGLTTQCESQHRAEVQRLIEEYFEHVRQGRLTTEQVANAQAALIGGHVLEMEDNLKRAEWLAQWAFAPDGWVLPDYAAAIRAVTPTDVRRVLNMYFTPQRRFVGAHQPLTTAPRTLRLIGATVGLNVAAWIARRVWQRVRGRHG